MVSKQKKWRFEMSFITNRSFSTSWGNSNANNFTKISFC